MGGTARGDGRTFDSNSSPSQSRDYVYINFSVDGSYTIDPHIDNPSESRFGSLGPYSDYTSFSVNRDPDSGNFTVEWDLLNGYASAARKAHDIASSYSNSDNLGERLVGGIAEGVTGVFLGAIDRIGLNKTIDGSVTLALNPQTGTYELIAMDSDPYPSIEIYHYINGDVAYEFTSPEWPPGRPDIGLDDDAPDRTYP